MMKSKVRCWRIENWRGKRTPDVVHITYPENNVGHDLISCLKCGHVYSVSVAKAIYIGPPLLSKLKGLQCISCEISLSESAHAYPDKYLSEDGVIKFVRSHEMPSDERSVVLDFDEIYS